MDAIRQGFNRLRYPRQQDHQVVAVGRDAGAQAPSNEQVAVSITHSQATEAVSTHFITGINPVYEPPDPATAIVDIVFVHGITGNRENTWKAAGKEHPWPQEFLPPVLGRARVLLFGYDARVANYREMVSQGRIADHASALLGALSGYRLNDNTNGRPIIFVPHSMGGLVCEDALRLSNEAPDAHLRAVIDCTYAICFMGTPHAGARALAQWAGRLANFIGYVRSVNEELLAVLETDSEVLARIQKTFHTMLRARQAQNLPVMQITCLYEQIELPAVGFVVHPQSAILPAYNSWPMQKNHIEMTKFAVDVDPDYFTIRNELLRWYREIENTSAERTRTKSIPPLRSEKEKAAYEIRDDLDLRFDQDLEDFRIAMPRTLIPDEERRHYGFETHPKQLFQGTQWRQIVNMFTSKHIQKRDGLVYRPLSSVPYQDRSFLALIRTDDLFRLLSSMVSEREGSSDAVIIHNMAFSISASHYSGIPVVKLNYCPTAHWTNQTVVPSKEYSSAISGRGSLKPCLSFGVNFVCSQPGYEGVQMPTLMAVYQIPGRFNVLFHRQRTQCFALWQIFVVLLDQAWDHDDAHECTPSDIPIKKYIDRFVKYTSQRRPLEPYNSQGGAYSHESGILQVECQRYFTRRAELVFENEDLSRLTNSAYDVASDVHSTDQDLRQASLITEWYARYDYEVSRWIILALTLTLGFNFTRCAPLPESFDVLLDTAECYIS